MKNYQVSFERLEESLLAEGEKNLPRENIQKALDWYKDFENQTYSDDEYFSKLVEVIFYSGFRAATVTSKLDIIHGHFPDNNAVANYGGEEIEAILADEKMIRNHRKIRACVQNAKVFETLISEYGSFQAYIGSFDATISFENLIFLKEELDYRFSRLGKITAYHYLTDIGFPVLKPDQVICRIFKRLGLIEDEKQLLKTIIQGRRFAEATKQPIRYIDIVFVAYGQVKSSEFGIEKGICLEKKPQCELCGIKEFCDYYKEEIIAR